MAWIRASAASSTCGPLRARPARRRPRPRPPAGRAPRPRPPAGRAPRPTAHARARARSAPDRHPVRWSLAFGFSAGAAASAGARRSPPACARRLGLLGAASLALRRAPLGGLAPLGCGASARACGLLGPRAPRPRLVGGSLLGASGSSASARRPRLFVSSLISLDLHRLGLLGGVRVLGAGVDLELGICWRARRLRGSIPWTALRITSSGRRSSISSRVRERIPPGIAAVTPVELVGALVPGHRDLLRVDDDDEVAGVAVRGVLGLALAAQGVGDLGSQPAERLALGVDDVPVALAVRRLGHVGLHRTKSRPDARSLRARPDDLSRAPAGWPAATPLPASIPRSRRAPEPTRATNALRRRPHSDLGRGTMGPVSKTGPAGPRKRGSLRMLPGAPPAWREWRRSISTGVLVAALAAGAASRLGRGRRRGRRQLGSSYAYRRDLPGALRRRPRGDRGIGGPAQRSQPRRRRRGPICRRRRRPGGDRSDLGRLERDRGRGPGARRVRNGQGARLWRRGRDAGRQAARGGGPGQIPERRAVRAHRRGGRTPSGLLRRATGTPGLLRLPAASDRRTSGSRSSTARPARSSTA